MIHRLLKTLLILSLVAFLSVAVLLGGWFYWACCGVFTTQTFAQKTWHMPHTDAEDGQCWRGAMADDLRKNVLHLGITDQEVAALLGEPDQRSRTQWRYNLGACSGLGIDYDLLYLTFDAQGRLLSSSIQQH